MLAHGSELEHYLTPEFDSSQPHLLGMHMAVAPVFVLIPLMARLTIAGIRKLMSKPPNAMPRSPTVVNAATPLRNMKLEFRLLMATPPALLSRTLTPPLPQDEPALMAPDMHRACCLVPLGQTLQCFPGNVTAMPPFLVVSLPVPLIVPTTVGVSLLLSLVVVLQLVIEMMLFLVVRVAPAENNGVRYTRVVIKVVAIFFGCLFTCLFTTLSMIYGVLPF